MAHSTQLKESPEIVTQHTFFFLLRDERVRNQEKAHYSKLQHDAQRLAAGTFSVFAADVHRERLSRIAYRGSP